MFSAWVYVAMLEQSPNGLLGTLLDVIASEARRSRKQPARAPTISSSAISSRAWTRLGLAIKQDTLVSCVPEHSASVQIPLFPRLDRARNHVATNSTPHKRFVDLVIITELFTDDEKIVVAIGLIGTARSASEQNDRPRMETFRKAVHRLIQSRILNWSLGSHQKPSKRRSFLFAIIL
jgi:hypothetical protein